MNRKVRNRDIDMIDKLVLQLKTGTPEEGYLAQKEILKYFDAYLEKYTGLFMGLGGDLMNYDTRGFLGMFLTGRPKTFENLLHQRSYIVKVMSRFEKSDIKNELTVIFLTVLDKHRIYKGVNALNPLTKLFRFRVKDWFNRVVKDPLFKTIPSFKVGEDGSVISMESFVDRLAPTEVDFEKKFSEINLRWVFCPNQAIHRQLTQYERNLIYLSYAQNLSSGKIAERLERDKDTIKRHLEVAKNKLKELYVQDKAVYRGD